MRLRGMQIGYTELVQSETSDFGFEVQDWSNLRFYKAVDESSIVMPQRERGTEQLDVKLVWKYLDRLEVVA